MAAVGRHMRVDGAAHQAALAGAGRTHHIEVVAGMAHGDAELDRGARPVLADDVGQRGAGTGVELQCRCIAARGQFTGQ
jgi:hypothetical protein